MRAGYAHPRLKLWRLGTIAYETRIQPLSPHCHTLEPIPIRRTLTLFRCKAEAALDSSKHRNVRKQNSR